LRNIAVFDVTQAKVVKYLPLASDNALIAASADKLIVILNDQNIIQRWDLKTLEKEVAAPLDAQVKSAAMGFASNGPLVINLTTMVDVASLKKLNVASTPQNTPAFSLANDGYQLRASADGTVVTAWRTNSSPAGVYVGMISQGSIRGSYQHMGDSYVLPSADGSAIFTGSGAVYTADLKPMMNPDPQRLTRYVPAYHPSYYLEIRYGAGSRVSSPRGPAFPSPEVGLYTISDRRLLLTLPPLEEMTSVQANPGYYAPPSTTFTIEKRYLFIPAAGVLVTIPETNDQIVVRKLDIIEAMEKAGIDYLFVDSSPRRAVAKGEDYEYRLAVRSKKGGVKYTLESGPTGMRISDDGVLTWRAPSDGSQSRVSVIISVKDSSGQEIYHSFNIDVR
jgi:hypothetical protein